MNSTTPEGMELRLVTVVGRHRLLFYVDGEGDFCFSFPETTYFVSPEAARALGEFISSAFPLHSNANPVAADLPAQELRPGAIMQLYRCKGSLEEGGPHLWAEEVQLEETERGGGTLETAPRKSCPDHEGNEG